MLNFNIFGVLRPELVVMTTPNREFNRFFGMKEHQLRHWDHKYEFSVGEFLHYCQTVVSTYPDYTFSVEGLGLYYKDERQVLEEFRKEYQGHIIT
mmetsp:Transcript_25664/g.24956  ORF Transcript_25664/g.24956 Transcript_25664/m.24956 type:complete len:95 (+) Transcript_25664:650-934(+)